MPKIREHNATYHELRLDAGRGLGRRQIKMGSCGSAAVGLVSCGCVGPWVGLWAVCESMSQIEIRKSSNANTT